MSRASLWEVKRDYQNTSWKGKVKLNSFLSFWVALGGATPCIMACCLKCGKNVSPLTFKVIDLLIIYSFKGPVEPQRTAMFSGLILSVQFIIKNFSGFWYAHLHEEETGTWCGVTVHIDGHEDGRYHNYHHHNDAHQETNLQPLITVLLAVLVSCYTKIRVKLLLNR